jgi:iron complex outermembrane receptor protein
MKVNHRTLLSCAVSSVLGFSASAALAQESGRSASVLEEIIVTAQKRSEGLQEVPVAVSAYTSETRDLLGVNTIADLTDFTPGLSYATTLDRMSLRGVGRLTNNYGSDPGIATYSDGFYTASNVEAGKRPIFTERIEVLRGPQGTLYGRNSIGGALNIISKRPTDTWQGEVRAVAGNYDTQIFDGSISGPITDWLRFKVAGSTGGQGVGFFRDVSDGLTEGNVSDDMYVEGQLEFNIGENFEGWFKYAHNEWNQKRRSIVQITPDDVAPVYFGGLFPNTTFNAPTTLAPTAFNAAQPPVLFLSGDRFVPTSPSLADPRHFDTDSPFHTDLDNVHIYTLELIWHTGFADVKYVGGYQGYTYQQVSDFDTVARGPYTVRVGGIPNPAVPGTFFPGAGQPAVYTIQPNVQAFYLEDKEYYSNEINLISNNDGPFQWIFGLYQYHEQVYQPSGVRVPLQAELENPHISATSATLGPANPNRDLQNAGAYLDADARAVFAQIDYNLTDHWKLTLGGRYTEDNKDADEFRTRVLYGFATRIPQNPAGTPPNPVAGFWAAIPFAFYSENNRQNHLSGEWHATTGTAGLEWTPTSDTLAFAKYTRGYKSGGFNAGQFAGLDGYTDPEFIDSYELGLKQTIAQRLTANLSIFYYDYKDAQYPSTVRDPVSNINESRFFNLNKATSQGVELEANWAATDALNLVLSYSYLDTEIDDDRCFIDNADTGILGQIVPDSRFCTTPTGTPTAPGPQVGQKLDGSALPSSPKNKAALNANYTFFTPGGNLTLSGTWTYRDKAYYSVFSREHYLAPAYDETDLRVLWNEPNDRYTIIAFCKNVFDDDGFEAAGATMSAWGVQSRSRSFTFPRTYGIEAQFRFGN